MEKKRKKRKKKYFLLNFIIAVLICGALVYYAGTDSFKVNTVLTKGNKHYSLGEIVKMAGIKSTENIFTFPTKHIKEELLKDPYIKNVSVSRRLPNKILITVEERKESASVTYGNKFVVIDEEGIVLRITDSRPSITLIKGITLTNIKAGTKIDTEEENVFQGVLDLLFAMDEHELFFREIQIDKSEVKAYIYEDLHCQGLPENILKSMDDLKDVLYDLYVKGIERGIIKIGGSGYISYSAVIE